MAYKVLNNILVKDAASNSLASLKTDLLVLVINKNTKNDSSGLVGRCRRCSRNSAYRWRHEFRSCSYSRDWKSPATLFLRFP
mgnify:CR=1 FL=1